MSDVTRTPAWQRLARPAPTRRVFDPADVEGAPETARRLLLHALRPGVPLATTAELEMTGEIRLGRWLPFEARQVLSAGRGFVWAPRIGRAPLAIRGADTFVAGRGTQDFRLWGTVPVSRASGPDTDRSAAGRLAAETVVWLPQALVPGMGATWTGIDDARATVAVPVGGRSIDVTVTVDDDGRLQEVSLQRWGDPDGHGHGLRPFGGGVHDEITVGGVTIAGAGEVGWWWGTDRPDDHSSRSPVPRQALRTGAGRAEPFFRYRITRAEFRIGTAGLPSRPSTTDPVRR